MSCNLHPRQKILRCYLRIPPCKGGMENHIKSLTEYQRALGFEVVIAFNAGNKTNENDIKILSKIDLSNLLPSPIYFFAFYFLLCFKLFTKGGKYDIIHIHGDWSSFIFAPLIKRITGSQKVYFSMHETIRNNLSHRLILPQVLKLSNKNFTTGFECYELIKAFNKTYFQPSGVDNIFFEQNFENRYTNQIKIITVAQFRPIKNLSLVIEIAEKLQNVHFTIVGDGDDFFKLKNEISIKNLTNVNLTGKLTKVQIAHLFNEHHIFLLTSLAEGTPTAVMEAMVCGLPIVSSNAGGTESIVKDYENGFVIRNDYCNIEAYINAINLLITNQELCKNIRNNNFIKAKDFKWDYVALNISNEMQNFNT